MLAEPPLYNTASNVKLSEGLGTRLRRRQLKLEGPGWLLGESFLTPGDLVTDPLPFLRSISHSCTVPSEAVTLKRKLPFTFFTKLGPSWLKEGRRPRWGKKERDRVRKERGRERGDDR